MAAAAIHADETARTPANCIINGVPMTINDENVLPATYSDANVSPDKSGNSVPAAGKGTTAPRIACNGMAACNCVLCGAGMTGVHTSLDVFSRLGPPPADVITISKLSDVTGASSAELHARGTRLCTDCHCRLAALHKLELQVARERSSLLSLYRRSLGPGRPSAEHVTSPGHRRLARTRDVSGSGPDQQSRRFQCQVCGRRFRAFSHRVEHMLIHLGERPHACALCPRRFRARSTLLAHGRTHAPRPGATAAAATGAEEIVCEQCGRRLSGAAALRAHQRAAHPPDRPFPCDTCGRQFARAKDRALHQRQHTGDRPHACPRCSLKFVSRSRLNRHMLVHAAAAHRCSCGRTFRRSYDLRIHAKRCQPAAQSGVTVAAAPVALLSALVLPEPTAAALYYQVVAPAAQPGPAQLQQAHLVAAQLQPDPAHAQLVTAQPDLAQLQKPDAAQLQQSQPELAHLQQAQLVPAQSDPAQLQQAQLVTARPDPAQLQQPQLVTALPGSAVLAAATQASAGCVTADVCGAETGAALTLVGTTTTTTTAAAAAAAAVN